PPQGYREESVSERGERFTSLLAATRVYAVTDDTLDEERLLQIVESLLDAGIRLIQYRDKVRSDQQRAKLACAIVERVHARHGLLLVNDRVDLALAAGADGAHLGQTDLP